MSVIAISKEYQTHSIITYEMNSTFVISFTTIPHHPIEQPPQIAQSNYGMLLF
jgi:hypothetical protein